MAPQGVRGVQIFVSKAGFVQKWPLTRTLRRKDLGDAGAKLFWKQYLRDVIEPVLPTEIKTGKKKPRDMPQPPDLPPLNVLADLWRQLKNMDQPKIEMERSSQSFNVTSKFLKLCQVLAPFEAEGEAFRGIVLGNTPRLTLPGDQLMLSQLVERDLTARILTTMLQLTNLDFLRIRFITSSGPNTDPEDTDNTRNVSHMSLKVILLHAVTDFKLAEPNRGRIPEWHNQPTCDHFHRRGSVRLTSSHLRCEVRIVAVSSRLSR